MKLIKVASAVLNQTPRDWKGNLENILAAINQAWEQGVTFLCLPEATITGYGLEDDLFCSDIPHRALLKLREIESALCGKNMVVCVGLPIRYNNTLYNSVATIINGRVAGFTCKQHLAGDGIHYEPRHYKPWPSGVTQEIEIPELKNDSYWEPFKEFPTFPIGDVHYDIGGVKVGYEICEDAWVANRPGTILATKGVDVYFNPSASHFAFGKLNTRKNFVVDGSRAFNATYIYSNLVGNEAGRTIYDGGALIATGGKLVAAGRRFTFQNVLLTTAIVDVDTTRTAQVRTSSFQPDVKHYNEGCVKVEFTYPQVNEKASVEPIAIEAWELSPNIKHEECTRAIGLALMDYMRKSHTKGFVISLSGGADSAMVTYLCSIGIKLAIAELGVVEFKRKYCPWATQQLTADGFIHQLITTAYQATENSGLITRGAAKQLAVAIGTIHFEFDVQPILKEYIKIAYLVKDNLNWKDDDITLQNLQARTRSPSIWIIANVEGKLLLTTSNMSEAAVGYATMDGDTSGCVAPIAGLSKVYIRQYLEWVETTGTTQFGPLDEMHYINVQQPTAELRPSEFKQTDEDDLMPYGLLHQIQSMLVKNRYTPVEIYLALKKEDVMPICNNDLIKNITKFFRLFSINQWKRERYALSFHMDDHNLDPRTWCRTPILTGGYAEELEELQRFLI